MRRLIAWMWLGVAGCTTPVDLDIPAGYEPRLVVDSRFTPDSVWAVRLSRSAPYADNASPESYAVTEAVAVVEGEDGFREELAHAGEGVFRSTADSRPVSGVRYALAADAPGLPPVRASSIVPPVVNAALVGLEEAEPPAEFKAGAYAIRLKLHDAPGSHRYSVVVDALEPVCYRDEGILTESENPESATLYRGVVSFTSDFPSLSDSIFQVEDASEPFVALEPFYGEAYFSDDLFEGKTLEIEIEATLENPSVLTPHFRILVRSWSDALWRHVDSVERYDLDSGFFADRPVTLYSNVEDGLGVFGGWSEVAFYVDAEGDAWSEEDLKTGRSHVRPCSEETENSG